MLNLKIIYLKKKLLEVLLSGSGTISEEVVVEVSFCHYLVVEIVQLLHV
jgi:hypothetical protein